MSAPVHPQALSWPRSALPPWRSGRLEAAWRVLAEAGRQCAFEAAANSVDHPQHRQSVSATEIVPRIIATAMPNTVPDTLRWTSVPFADRFGIWDHGREP
jgi:hypothetical protein